MWKFALQKNTEADRYTIEIQKKKKHKVVEKISNIIANIIANVH
jgi:hypothetical protein